jgi:hypothetical protein
VAIVSLMLIDARGRGTSGSAEAGTFTVTLIPGDEGGRGRVVDTTVREAEAGDSLDMNRQAEGPPAGRPRLLGVVQTDPQAVFRADGAESLTLVSETAMTTRPRIPSDAETVRSDDPATLEADRDPAAAERSVTSAQTSMPAGDAMASASSSSADSNSRDGSGRGHKIGPGEGRASGTNGNRTEFFGIVTRAKRVVYVIDASESMRRHNAMELARKRLWSSLEELSPTAQFQIVFFNVTNHVMGRTGEKPRLLPATSSNLRLAKQFLTGIQPDAGTDRLAAMMQAMSLDPDVVYLLTDADAPELSARDLFDLRRRNKRKAIVNVVEFGFTITTTWGGMRNNGRSCRSFLSVNPP